MLIPLFPLDLVLLPGVPLPLHIFEPRYEEMINECLEQKKHFGLIRNREEVLATVGCTAEILQVLKKHPDGRMDILAEGKKRFEVLGMNQERSFLQAEVFFLEDEGQAAEASDIEAALRPDFQQALLEMNSEAERMRALVAFFERLLPVLQRNAAARQKAGGNGHVN